MRAIDGVDLATEEGEYLVLLGPSGCGKTTLLRTIAGLEQPTAGRRADRRPGRHRPAAAGPQVAMVFQSYALYPHKTVLRATSSSRCGRQGCRRTSGSASRAGRPTCSASSTCWTASRASSPAASGSGWRWPGRWCASRSVFLLDEPLSNLDAKLRATARDELKRFQEEIGTTTIYVTHDQVEAMGLGDRIAVLSEGAVRQIGPPVEVYDDPADTFVATFIGSPPMNLVPQRRRAASGSGPSTCCRSENDRRGDAVHVTLGGRPRRVPVRRPARLRHGQGIGEPTRVVARLPATVDDADRGRGDSTSSRWPTAGCGSSTPTPACAREPAARLTDRSP